ncbi:MAG: FecR family protein [Tannerellaceae bacterium]|jgi:ferric-dicitrate binding protein FerR (iron transport regulator)|nr:FecR family protein [Tannerellaceae bacterium]
MKQIPPHIEKTVISLFSGEASDAEVTLLRQWVNASPEHYEALETYRKVNRFVGASQRPGEYSSSEAWGRLKALLQQDSPPPPRKPFPFPAKWLCRIAAVFILAFGGGMATMYHLTRKQAPEEASVFFTEHTVPYGSKSKIVLPDSSTVWLNAGSKLRYSSAFNRSDREVLIEGEAYFHVAKNRKKPFHVKTSAVTLRVLGTSFNVKAYPEENHIETTVESGTVQVLRNVEGQLMDKLVLTAGQKATVVRQVRADSTEAPVPSLPAAPVYLPEETAEKTIVAKNVETELYTSWKDTRWLINKETLESLAVKLERRHNVRIAFTDEQLKHYSFSGSLEDETLEQVLEAIKLSAPIDYSIKQNQVKLSRNRWITK